MAGHLGKGLGALFPSLTPQPAQNRQNAGQNTRPAAQDVTESQNGRLNGRLSDNRANNRRAAQDQNTKTAGTASGAVAKTASTSAPGGRPLAASAPDRHGTDGDTGHTRNTADSGRRAPKAGDTADGGRQQNSRQQAGGQRNSRRRHSVTPHIPDWDEIAHPVDLFFGGAAPAPARPDTASGHTGAHSGNSWAQGSSDRATGAQATSSSTTGEPATDSSTVSASNNVSRETSVSVPGSPSTQPAADGPKTVVSGAASGQDGRRAGQDVVTEPLRPVNGAYLTQIRVDDIVPNPKQPRTVFDEEELKELSDSIKEVGVLQPVVVIKRDSDRKTRAEETGEAKDQSVKDQDTAENSTAEDSIAAGSAGRDSAGQDSAAEDADRQNEGAHYELVMGERRWRASKMAGLDTIPAIVRTATSEQLLRDALLENLQRVQLNPLEEAAAYQQMMQEFGLTQQKLSEAVSKSRPQIANTLRLLQLPAPVQKLVASGVLSAGHARALLTLTSHKQMIELADRIVKEGLSVRSTEEIVALHSGKKGTAKRASSQLSADYWAGTGIPERLEDRLQTKVAIRGNEKKGRIVITFASREDLDRLTQLLAGASDADKDEDGWV